LARGIVILSLIVILKTTQSSRHVCRGAARTCDSDQ